MAKSGLYVKLDSNFPDDEKIEDVGLEGAGLYAMALCVAKRLNEDGRIRRSKLRRLGASDDLIDECVAVGLFTEDGDSVFIAAWLGHNESAEDIATRRAEDAARKRVTRAKRPAGHSETSGRSPSGRADLEEEEEEDKKRTDAAFAEWWMAYPRKESKQSARKAYAKALTDGPKKSRPTTEALTEALSAQCSVWRRENRPVDKMPHAATWLNGRRWEDEVLSSPPDPVAPVRVVER